MPLPLLFALVSPVTQVASDPRLTAKVDARLKIASVEEAVRTLGQAGGVRLDAAPEMAELKTTILVEGVPLGRTMDRLADVLQGKWVKRSEGYRLIADPKIAAQYDLYAKHRREALQREALRRMNDLARLGGMSFAEACRKHDEAAARVNKEPQSDDERKKAEAEFQRYRYANQRGDWAMGCALAAMDEGTRKRFMTGEAVAASTTAAPGTIRLPNAVLDSQSPDEPGYQREDLYLRYDPSTGMLRGRLDGTIDDHRGDSEIPTIVFQAEDSDDWHEGDEPEAAMEWGMPNDEAAEAKGTIRENTPERPSVWWTGDFSASDHLEWLHDATGLPIVAMADRQPDPRERLKTSGTIGEYLKSWRERRGDAFRFDDGFLMARPANFWLDRERAVPESRFRALERTPVPEIDAYGDFAATLTDAQGEDVGASNVTLLRVCPYPLEWRAFAGMRLFGRLSPDQRRTIRAGGSLPYASLDAEAQAAFRSAVSPLLGGVSFAGRLELLQNRGGAAWNLFGATGRTFLGSQPRPQKLSDWPKGIAPKMDPAPPSIGLNLGPTESPSIGFILPLRGVAKESLD